MKYLLLLILSAGACMAQVTADKTTGCFSNADGSCAHSQPAPLKCGKFEEFEPAHSEHESGDIFVDYPDRCVPKLHIVTEKDWRHLGDAMKVDEEKIRVLMNHIHELEKRICTDDKGVLHECHK